MALESCLYERVTPNSPNSLKICMLAIFWLQPVDQTWSKCEQMTLFTTIEIQIWLNKVSVCYVGAVIIFKMNDSAGSICFCHSIDPALPIDHDHIALPTYTYRLFILIDWTGSFLIMGMSVVYLLSISLSLSLSLSLSVRNTLFHVHIVGPDQMFKVLSLGHLSQNSISEPRDTDSDIRTITCITKLVREASNNKERGNERKHSKKKLEGHIAFGSFVRSIVRSFDTPCKEIL